LFVASGDRLGSGVRQGRRSIRARGGGGPSRDPTTGPRVVISLAEAPRTTDALRAFRSTIRAFVQTEFVPHQDRWREQRFPDPDSWTKAGAVGMLLSDVPAEYGGGGGTFVHETVVVEELTRAGVPLHSFIHDNVAHYILARSEERRVGKECRSRGWRDQCKRKRDE